MYKKEEKKDEIEKETRGKCRKVIKGKDGERKRRQSVREYRNQESKMK
jgi:hypothetical protein